MTTIFTRVDSAESLGDDESSSSESLDIDVHAPEEMRAHYANGNDSDNEDDAGGLATHHIILFVLLALIILIDPFLTHIWNDPTRTPRMV